MFAKKDINSQTKLADWLKVVVSIVTITIAIVGSLWGSFTYLDNTFAKAADVKGVELRIEKNTVDTFEKQQRILDIRYLEQLQCQQALIQKELERDPGDRLLRDKLRRIENAIEKVEDILYQ